MKYILTTLLFFLSFIMTAQDLQVFSTAGDCTENSTVGTLSWTLGEVITETFDNENSTLTSGYQQSRLTTDCLEDFMVMHNVLCLDTTYQILIAFDSEGVGENGYNILDNINGTQYDNITANSLNLGPFEFNTGYSYTVSIADNPACSETFGTAIVSCTATAIELVSFDGNTQKRANQLTWKTASEYNSDYFIVESSIDGIHFQEVGKITAQSNSSTTQEYEHLDYDHQNKSLYYRLKETDKEGFTQVVSKVIFLERDVHTTPFEILAVFPIPARETLSVQYHIEKATNIQASIYDVTGKLIEQKMMDTHIGFNQLDWSLASYNAGTYFIQLTNNEEVVLSKFIKTQ